MLPHCFALGIGGFWRERLIILVHRAIPSFENHRLRATVDYPVLQAGSMAEYLH